MSNQHGLSVTKPVSVWNKTIQTDYRKFFLSLTKAAANGVTGNMGRALSDAVDAVSATGLGIDCGETAYLLIHRSLLQAVYTLVEENSALLDRDEENPATRLRQLGLPPDDPDSVTSLLDLSLEQSELVIDENFFRRPRELSILENFKTPFRQWLEMFGLNAAEASSIVNRLPSYFVHALNDQWRRRPDDYKCLKEAVDTPFTKASAAEQAWRGYAAALQKQVDEPMFIEAFSLRQVYVSPRAYFLEKTATEKEERFEPRSPEASGSKRIVLDLETELESWLDNAEAGDAIRILSGEPGSGKSSFAKMFAARQSERNGRRVMFVPLHLLELSDDLETSLAKFIRYLDPALTNPLSPEERATPYLVIFDGLDELAMQGRIAAELAQQFVREVRDKTSLLNLRSGGHLKVLVSGRELSVQSYASDFKRPRQILTFLPYFVPTDSREEFTDAQNLLERDQRDEWWSKYGAASGHGYDRLPPELNRDELEDITSQPLLNYLVALSHTRGEIDLATESNLNVIYRDLLKAVYERGWGGHRHLAVQGIEEEKFVRWLEEIAVAAWHGHGRTTTVEEIKGHTESSGAGNLLKLFEEGADKGITRLLMAFYFRRAGVRDSGDRTFEFTHKSFGEYLTARRIVRLLKDIHEELERHRQDVDKGWNEVASLERWIRLCGKSALDNYIYKFIEHEVHLSGEKQASAWQETLCRLITYELHQGLPMEKVGIPTFKEQTRQARNVEESLIVVLSACARATQKRSKIEWPDQNSFGELMLRTVGQTYLYEDSFIQQHLNFIEANDSNIAHQNFPEANFQNVGLARIYCPRSNLIASTWADADLRQATLDTADLSHADLSHADLSHADLISADLRGADLSGANLSGANLSGAHLNDIHYDETTRFSGAVLDGAFFTDDAQREAILRLAEVDEDKSLSPEGDEEQG
jgi:hypothetical protein